MKKIALTSLLTIFAVSAASAATSPYVAAHIGYTAPNLTFYENHKHNGAFYNDNFAYDLSFAAGVKSDLSKAFALRGEVEYDFINGTNLNNGNDIWVHTNTLLFNGYIDMKTVSALTPYIGAGIGYQWNHFDILEGFKPHGLAWQVGGGLSYALCDHLSMDFGYRYLSSVDKEGNAKIRAAYHQFRLGAAYAF